MRRRLPLRSSSAPCRSTKTSSATSPSAWTPSRRVRRPSCSVAPTRWIVRATAATVPSAAAGAIARAASVRVSVTRAVPPPAPAAWEKKNERAASSLHPPSQVLPVLRRQRAEDRLQGRAPPPALHLGARQDRAEPHFRGLVQEAART